MIIRFHTIYSFFAKFSQFPQKYFANSMRYESCAALMPAVIFSSSIFRFSIFIISLMVQLLSVSCIVTCILSKNTDSMCDITKKPRSGGADRGGRGTSKTKQVSNVPLHFTEWRDNEQVPKITIREMEPSEV